MPRSECLTLLMAIVLMATVPVSAAAQAPGSKIEIGGEVSALGMTMPSQPEGGATHELRSRARLEVTADPAGWLRLKFDGTVDGLLADRNGRVDDLIARAREAWIEIRGPRADLRAGYGRLVWGRLDEIMPSDVLNPIETAPYFLEGRSEARLPILFARGRAFVTGETSIEAIVSLPGRRGRFDELEESSSPFNLLHDSALPALAIERIHRLEPSATWDNLQFGGRVSSTIGRVDMSVAAYRGFESFGVLAYGPAREVLPEGLEVGELVERYPRFTMVATDAEAVVGSWAVRAEVALFPDRQVIGPVGASPGRALDAGIGLDRSAGQYHLFGSMVWHRDWTTGTRLAAPLVNHDVSIIGSIERRFSRDRYLVRVFGVGNPVDESGFVRTVLAWSARDNVTLEGSGGVFFGSATSSDTLSRFRRRDFVFTRLRWHF